MKITAAEMERKYTIHSWKLSKLNYSDVRSAALILFISFTFQIRFRSAIAKVRGTHAEP